MPTSQSSQNRANTEEPRVFSVSDLNRQARQLLEMHLNNVLVEGEISNMATPSSGHWYFTLKDDDAQVRCAMFRNRNSRVGFIPEAGMLVRVRAKVSIYEGRGDYQLIVEHLEDAGVGALQRAFEQLKRKLADEGLFNQEFKQALPDLPCHIGVITSPTGAAVHDILTTLKRRFPAIPVTLIPTAVQGKEAPAEIARALALANRSDLFDVLIVGRGGGSLEDLWAFNDETVARAIFSSEVPIVSAVGHEVDFSIADFVADLRAPTPTAAAELITPDQREMLDNLCSYENFFISFIQQLITEQKRHVQYLNKYLKHPGQIVREQTQRLDNLELRLQQTTLNRIQHNKNRQQNIQLRFHQLKPDERLTLLRVQLQYLQQQLKQHLQLNLQVKVRQLENLSQLLNSVSPLNTLNRGYSITSDSNNQIVENSEQLTEGDIVTTQLKSGSFNSRITDIISSDKKT